MATPTRRPGWSPSPSSLPAARQLQPRDAESTNEPGAPPVPPLLELAEVDAEDVVELVLVLAASHVPIVPVVELHICPFGQPEVPVPRQPAVHVFVVMLQTRPEFAAPQSVSTMQPHVSDARHTAPLPSAVQAWAWPVAPGVHCTQWFMESHTFSPAVLQSGSLRHCTHTWGCRMVSQTPTPVVLQSALLLQGSAMHVPTEPFVWVQYSPVAQFVPPFTTRQPALQTPVEVVVVSQYVSALQSLSAVQPHVAVDVMQTGVVAVPAHSVWFVAEQMAHCPASPVPVG
jgi:hypothetical protein